MKLYIQLVTASHSSNLLRKIFMEQEHEIVSNLSNYKDVLNSYIELQPDVTYIDLDIAPLREGLKLCRQIYSIDNHAHVVVFSEYFSPEIKAELFEIGVEYWLEKPFQTTKVLSTIDSICKNNNILNLREKRASLKINFNDNNTNLLSQKEIMNNNINSLRQQIETQRQIDESNSYKTKESEVLSSDSNNFLKLKHKDTLSLELDFNTFEDDFRTDQTKEYENIGYLGLPKFINNESFIEDENFHFKERYSESVSDKNETNVNKDKTLNSKFGFIKKLRKK